MVVAVLGIVAVGVWAVVSGSGAPRSTEAVSVDVGSLRDGHVLPVPVTLPGQGEKSARVFFVRDEDRLHAFLGVSTHLGCRLLVPGDRNYGTGFDLPRRPVTMQDPCGGSVYALSGECISGPCPRGLDYYDITLAGTSARIDLADLIRGAPKYDS